MQDKVKKHLESRMLGNLHVRFGVGVGVKIPGLHYENNILRTELIKATGKKQIFLSDAQRRRLAILAKKVGRKALFDISAVFSPDTLLMLHRKPVTRKYDGSRNRSPGGRPPIPDSVREFVIQVAKDNKHLGAKSFHGFLKYLGLKVSPATINRIFREHGIEPSPDRPERTTWNEFIKRHWDSLAAIDFFTTGARSREPLGLRHRVDPAKHSPGTTRSQG